tara:strand:- start:1632 stop:1802 length:171 start_codon:yes stop_codon:yes gene_type:complete
MFNKVATSVGLTLGAASNAVAGNSTDAIVEMLPIIVELAIVVALLGWIIKLMKGLK